MRTLHLGARAFIPVAIAAPSSSAPPRRPRPPPSTTTEAQQIVRIAKAQYGDPWRYGATGPSAFDCSGLVVYAYRQGRRRRRRSGTALRSARALYLWIQGARPGQPHQPEGR